MVTLRCRSLSVLCLLLACGLSVDGRRLNPGNDSKAASDEELGRQLKGRGGRRGGRRPSAPPPRDAIAGAARAALGVAPVAAVATVATVAAVGAADPAVATVAAVGVP